MFSSVEERLAWRKAIKRVRSEALPNYYDARLVGDMGSGAPIFTPLDTVQRAPAAATVPVSASAATASSVRDTDDESDDEEFTPISQPNEFVVESTGLVEAGAAEHYASLSDAVSFSQDSHYAQLELSKNSGSEYDSVLQPDDIDVNLLPASSEYGVAGLGSSEYGPGPPELSASSGYGRVTTLDWSQVRTTDRANKPNSNPFLSHTQADLDAQQARYGRVPAGAQSGYG